MGIGAAEERKALRQIDVRGPVGAPQPVSQPAHADVEDLPLVVAKIGVESVQIFARILEGQSAFE